MRTTLTLLNQVMNLGFDQSKALLRIDATLDKRLGIEVRKPLFDEKLPYDIYEDILEVFRKEAEHNHN